MKDLFKQPQTLIVLAAGGLLAVVAALVYSNRDPAKDDRETGVASVKPVIVGGVERNPADVQKMRRVLSDKLKGEAETLNPAKRYGQAPRLKPDANPTVVSAAQAIDSQTHPERLSPMLLPSDFVLAQYSSDPKVYLQEHVPGRVFQSAQPGPDVPVIKPMSPQRHRINQGESVRLRVQSFPNAPVTFTSFDLGTFSNGLASISVEANEEGIAEAEFTGSRGKVGEVNLLAASPMAAERVDFKVFVIPPVPEAR